MGLIYLRNHITLGKAHLGHGLAGNGVFGDTSPCPDSVWGNRMLSNEPTLNYPSTVHPLQEILNYVLISH